LSELWHADEEGPPERRDQFGREQEYGEAEPSKAEGDDPFPAESGVESERIPVTLAAKGITRREALWRIEKQCALEMTIARDESGSPRCVFIKQRKRNAEPPPGNQLVTFSEKDNAEKTIETSSPA